ncbi:MULTISPECIES: type II toxin-antitoxin system Phd/YefM family antitoxin [unclassified Enterococcus]|uniref:type II toxin-antitoxin system Phd/YefM family antitoxin n=1 Tax=unclassified Enterococcus TaxID=2608891 RepID=UPI000A331BD7|nr:MULTISPECIES: type II toxin-antitoxin system Phd/YefM family antitoxin [unclassified Enterococcus]OTO67762.1 toxin-antitoxin system, antitoxin component [Enterococcus sp. 12E11_DIV0728]OUZ15700.1 toxin-antitoxin system, antitoxin component [Enterococcus sp. 12F9_DIV0723]
MANTVFNPSSARKNFYQLLKEVNENHTEIEIISDRSENNAVLIGLEDWRAIQETLFLEQTGTLDTVRTREKEDSGFTDVDEIDWDSL